MFTTLFELWSDPAALAQAVLVAVSFLSAFLTVVQVWQIPPPSRRLSGDGATTEEPAPTPLQPDQSKDFSANLLSNNFSRTVLGGLVGLTAVTFLDSFFQASGEIGANAKAYYVVLFITFFLALLFISAVFRGLVEAGRSRIVLSRQVASWPPSLRKEGVSRSLRFQRWLGFWLRRVWYWMVSFRATTLVFADTFFNVIQGKNQLKAAALSDTIVDLHEALVEAAERVRDEVHAEVVKALPGDLPEDAVRVAVSLLSADESKVYYISRERGSLSKEFHQGSLAWISAYTSEARWCKTGPLLDSHDNIKKWEEVYAGNPLAIVLDNRKGTIPAPPQELPLSQYFETRSSADYEAFIVLPMPWNHRGTVGHRRGAIHISFKKAYYMDLLWANLERYDAEKKGWIPNYRSHRELLQLSSPKPVSKSGEVPKEDIFIHSPELRSTLRQALEVLGDALGHFDDEVFSEYVQLRRHM
jgi:hypothetical protein